MEQYKKDMEKNRAIKSVGRGGAEVGTGPRSLTYTLLSLPLASQTLLPATEWVYDESVIRHYTLNLSALVKCDKRALHLKRDPPRTAGHKQLPYTIHTGSEMVVDSYFCLICRFISYNQRILTWKWQKYKCTSHQYRSVFVEAVEICIKVLLFKLFLRTGHEPWRYEDSPDLSFLG